MTEKDTTVKTNVRQFYDRVGWQMENDGYYQNARYEDLRPVSAEYIHRCHMRVNSHLDQNGKFLLDAGSGPIQYPEYMTYSETYQYRVCADLSIEGLKEARKRTGAHGLCVVADVANLPFKDGAFDGIVSLHTIHHVPATEKKQAYLEIFRTLKAGHRAVVVNGWTHSPFMNRLAWMVKLSNAARYRLAVLRGKEVSKANPKKEIKLEGKPEEKPAEQSPTGTFIQKMSPELLRKELGSIMDLQIFVWRSVSVRFLRAVIQPWALGKQLLRWLYHLEEKNPQKYGEEGQYPMIAIRKPETAQTEEKVA